MNEVDYQIQINEYIDSLSPQELKDKLLSIAYSIPLNQREAFLKYFEEDSKVQDEKSDEYTLINDGFEKALIFLDEVTNQEICLNRVYTRDEDSEVDSSHIEDPYSIEKNMHDVFLLVDRLLDDKEYSKALAIYSKLKEFNIYVNDEDYEMYSYDLDEYYCDSSSFDEDISYVGTRALFCIYSISGPLDIKSNKVNDYLNSPLCRSVNAKQFLKCCRDKSEHLEEFLVLLMKELFNTPGQKSVEWLNTIAPINLIENNLEESSKIHPRLHRILMNKYIDARLYNEAFDVGIKALSSLDNTLVERAKVANLLINISLFKRGMIEEDNIINYYYTSSLFSLESSEIEFLYERFISKSSLNNLLSLYKVASQNAAILQKVDIFLHERKVNLVNEDEDTELITNIVSRDVESLGFFLANQDEESTNLLISRYPSFDREYKNIMLNIFLLFFVQEDKKYEGLNSIAPDTRDLGYDSELYVNISFNISEQIRLKLIKWMSEVFFNIADFILKNKEEEYYQRTAKMIKAFNDLLISQNLDFMQTDIISYYKNTYYNHHKFKALLSDIL